MARLRALALAVALTLALASPAAARLEFDTVAVRGVPAAGPSEYDRVFVTRWGPASADWVLVLMPGHSGGAGDFTLVARDIVRRVPDLQVWAVDRRSQALEDTSMFDRGWRGEATPQEVYDYYLGRLLDPGLPGPRFEPPDVSELGFAAEWGLPTAIGDLRRVIARARRQGKRVVLGGHSLGASMAEVYATWDFAGRPGHRDIEGLVLIDGGQLGSFVRSPSVASVRRQLEDIRRQPFSDLVGIGLPWAQGVFAGIGGLFAHVLPTERSPFADLQLLPEQFKPPVPATNRAFLGYAFDASTSPEELSLIHLRAGRLADSGDPRDWVSGEVSPIGRVAAFWAASPVNGVEWFFPRRLSLDVDAANDLRETRAARELDLRLRHLGTVDVPLYAFQTDLTDGRVLRGARRFVARSRVRRSEATLVDRSRSTSHLDPLTATPSRNDFLKTVVPFLRRLTR